MIENTHGSSGPSEWIREKLQAVVDPVKSAIDVASGAGRHSLLLSELCPSVTAVDRNPDLSGVFATRTATAQKQIDNFTQELADLDSRYELIYQRYLDQFIVMERLVNSLNSTRESMSTTWENMSKNFGK